MKKLLSVLLALVMVFSLTVPALATAPEKDLDPPLWRILGYNSYEELIGGEYSYWTEEEYAEEVASVLSFMEANPDLTAQFRANAYSYFGEIFAGNSGTAQEYMAEYEETEEQFITDMTVWQIWDYQATKEYVDAWAATCAEQPERTALFLEELPTWFTQRYPWYDSLEEYTEYCDCIEEAYLDLFAVWNYSYTQEQQQEQAKKDFITSHGGVNGQINVMLNGQFVKFTDAVPALKQGRTMVPFRAIFETLGAEISYDNGKIHAVLGDTTLDLTLGSDTMTKTVAGKASTIKMDCAPYLKDNRTYVPLRFISEALGYDVQWDDYYRAAVITDLDALAAQIDKDFTIYNKMAGKSAVTDKAQKFTGSGKADVTLFDSLDGDKAGKGTCSYDLTASTAGVSGKFQYDLSELWSLLEAYIPMPLDDGSTLDLDASNESAQALALIKALMKGSMELRMDLEKGKMYVSMPDLFQVMNSMSDSGVQIPKDAWLSASISDGTDPDLTAMMGQSLTMGKLLATIGNAGSYRPAENYGDTLEAAAAFGEIYGDAKFTRQGSANVLKLTKQDLLDLGDYSAEDLESLSKFEFTLTVQDNGDASLSCQLRMALDSSDIKLGDFVDLSATASIQSGKTDYSMEVHVKNVLKATITLQETRTETNQAPELTPPSDALVLPADGSLGNIPQ